ncbi:MAG: Crp/Fnr family transcriptional regulator [Flavobacterium sp.]|nr:Crp/Fnr family transcriptional regulator [Flavobacterium sp.]
MSKCEQCIVRELSSLKTLRKDELLKVAECKVSTTIKKGSTIFGEGESVNGVFCIKDGVCKLTKLSPSGKNHIVKLVSKGELLGQRSLISDETANLSAVALEDMEVCFIPKAEIMGFFNDNSLFSMQVMKNICGDLKDADELMVNMAQKSVKERLAFTLIYLKETFGTNADGTLKLQLSRDEIASIIGTAVESCIRLLSELNKSGIISLTGKTITITDLAQLKRIAND